MDDGTGSIVNLGGSESDVPPGSLSLSTDN